MSGVEKMLEALKRRKELGLKNKKPEHNLIKRYGLDTRSRKESIHMFCFSCIGGDEHVMPDPGWKKEISTCDIKKCPLHKWRPYQSS